MKIKAITPRKLESAITQYTVILIALLLIGGYFGYQNYTAYSATNTALSDAQQRVVNLQKDANKLSESYLQTKKDFDDQNASLYLALNNVLPLNEDFTDLARTLDKYFLDNGNDSNKLFLSDLRFSPPEINDANDFGVLPFTMSVVGDYTAVENFMKYIEASGNLNSPQVRLMDAKTINLALSSPTIQTSDAALNAAPAPSTDINSKDVSASLTLRSFFKKPQNNPK